MGYLFLSLSLFSGAAKGFCGKKLGNFADNRKSAIFLNGIRMLFCILFGFCVVILSGDFSGLGLSVGQIAVSALSGIATAVFVVSWLIAVRKNAYMMLDVFLMLGTLVPMLAGRIFYAEKIGFKRFFCFAVLISAAFIMCSYSNKIKTKLNLSAVLLLILCGIANGITDFSQKICVKIYPEMPIAVFGFYTYLFAFFALIIALPIVGGKEKISFDKKSGKLSVLYILIMAVALFANSYFKTKAAVFLESSLLYPINQALSLVLSSLMATVFFKEKFTLQALVGIVLSFIGLMIMNF